MQQGSFRDLCAAEVTAFVARLTAAAEAADSAAAADVARVQRRLEEQAAERLMVDGVLARATAQIDALTANQTRTDSALARVTEQRDALAADIMARDADAARLRSAAERAAARLGHLHDTFERLASGDSIDGVLHAAANGFAAECARVALMRVEGGQLECIERIGFGDGTDPPPLAVPLAIDSVFATALATDRIQVLTMDGAEAQIRVPFQGEPSFALVLPLRVHGEAVALVYADDVGEAHPGSTTMAQLLMVADLLRRHAIARLETLAIEPLALNELRAYAALLLEEVEYRYDAAVDGGAKGEDLLADLRRNLDGARQIYAQRAQGEAPATAALLEGQLAALVAARPETPFGRDLQAIVSGGPEESAVHGRPEEASVPGGPEEQARPTSVGT